MANSTSTKLDIINRSLLAVGDRRVSSSTISPTAIKCHDALRDALHTLCTADNWSWLRKVLTSPDVTWSGEKVTLPSYRVLHSVQTAQVVSYPAKELDYSDFTYLPNTAWSGDTDFVQYYHIFNDSEILCKSYPTTNDQRNKVTFTVTGYVTLPALDSDTLPIPERYVPALTARLNLLMAERHLGDTAMADVFAREYAAELQTMRNSERMTSPRTPNMFKW